jgi:hypothetical protein
MRQNFPGKLTALGFGLLGWIAVAGPARAMDTCNGEFSASPLRALPKPAVVGVDLTASTDTNTALADAFTRGMSNAGAQVPGSQTETVKLRLTWQVLGQGGSNPGSGNNALVPMQPGPQGTGAAIWSGNSQTFLSGGIDRSLPDMPNYSVFAPGQSAQSGLLIFRAEARDVSGDTIYWIGSVQCTMTGGDNQMLAYQLGQLIGGALGQRRDRVSM